MKKLLPLAFCILLSGCVMLGNQVIHSPSAEGGYHGRMRHVHGGVTKKSPPGIVALFNDDASVSLLISAQIISEKTKWFGIALPIFPNFFKRPIDHYKNEPETLILEMTLESHSELTLFKDLMRIQTNQKLFVPYEILYKEKAYRETELTISPTTYDRFSSVLQANSMSRLENPATIRLKYPIRASDVLEFQLLPEGIYANGRSIEFPKIRFKKTKQRWTFVGP